MAREYAPVRVNIWADEDWRSLTGNAQRLYFLLLTSPSLNHCGVADWRPRRLAVFADDWTVETVEAAGDELVERYFLVIDEDTEEVLIRSFVRHDGLMKQPKMAVAMASAFAGVASSHLRGVIVHELQRLKEDEPTLNGWVPERVSEILAQPAINPKGNPIGKGIGKGIGNPKPPVPTPTTSNLEPSASEPKTRKRAPETPIPDDWQPTDKHRQMAEERGLDLSAEAFRFRNHALANDRRQRDWNASFNTWLSKAKDFAPKRQQTQQIVGEWWR